MSCDRIAGTIEMVPERHRQEIATDLDLRLPRPHLLEVVSYHALQTPPVNIGSERMIGQRRAMIMAYAGQLGPRRYFLAVFYGVSKYMGL
jgi:hypothetical protein